MSTNISIVMMVSEVTTPSALGERELTFQLEFCKLRWYFHGEFNAWAQLLRPSHIYAQWS